MPISTQIVGVPEFQAKLRLIVERATGAESARVFLAAAKVIRDEAARNAPRSKYPAFTRLKSGVRSVPGTLQKSIVAFTSRSSGAAFARVNVFKGANPARHAHLVHFGTRNRLPKSGNKLVFLAGAHDYGKFEGQGGRFIFAKSTRGLTPNPFFQKAVQSQGDAALDKAAEAMQKIITKDLR